MNARERVGCLLVVVVSSIVAVADRGGRGLLRTGARAVARVGGRPAAVAVPRGHAATEPDGSVKDGATAGAASFMEGRVADLATVRVAYERRGAGEPVVLLHGLGLDRRAWDAVVPLLAGEREVIAMDLPGFGQSPDFPACLRRDLPTMVAALGAVFTALGLQRPHVVGHSLGGLIALRLAQADYARTVTALAPAGFWNRTERRYAFAVLIAARRIARLPDTALARLSGTLIGRAALTGTLYGRPDHCPPDAVLACLRPLRDAVGFDATLHAGRAPGLFTGDIAGVPVTMAWGTRDRVLPPRQAARAKTMITQARLIWLPGCGHVPMNDAPDLVARIILQATGPLARPPLPGQDSRPRGPGRRRLAGSPARFPA